MLDQKPTQTGFSVNEHTKLPYPAECCCIQQSKLQRHRDTVSLMSEQRGAQICSTAGSMTVWAG